jgi:hypothetical protein
MDMNAGFVSAILKWPFKMSGCFHPPPGPGAFLPDVKVSLKNTHFTTGSGTFHLPTHSRQILYESTPMSALEKAIELLCTGGAALTIEFTSAAESGLLDEKCSFLTLALNIIGETGSAAVIADEAGRLLHCGLHCPETGLVLDATGIRPAAAQEARWMARLPGGCSQTIMAMDQLEALSPPECGFYARVLAAFEKVAAASIHQSASPAAPKALPALVGYQVQNEFGVHWARRASYEILNQETATADLFAARTSPVGTWLMVAIFDGDIEDPAFI